MRFRTNLIIVLAIFLLSGCMVKNVVKGDYYLSNKKYKSGIHSFEEELKKDPYSPRVHYYLARFYLADNHPEKGLTHIQKAVTFEPGKAEYRFWLGIALGVNKMKKKEWESYEYALKLDPNHLKSRVYLAHTQMERGYFKKALKNYSYVLKKKPGDPASLYNRALIIGKLKRSKEEKTAWKEYLDYYPSGPMAIKAAGHLNSLGDFSYRNHLIGIRTIPLKKITFKPFDLELTKDSLIFLNFLGQTLEEANTVSIHIIVYQKNNKQLAEQKAKHIKKYLIGKYPRIISSRLKVSWFDVSEKIKSGKNSFLEDESINFITAI